MYLFSFWGALPEATLAMYPAHAFFGADHALVVKESNANKKYFTSNSPLFGFVIQIELGV
jgi:hypothetical protein